MQCVRDCDADPNKRKLFNQPVLQTAQMFVGEMGCWLVVGEARAEEVEGALERGELAVLGTAQAQEAREGLAMGEC